jgi:KDO2-lipid IV(A) lauroyltransferase
MPRTGSPTVAHRLQWWSFLAAEKLVGLLPWSACRILGRGLGRLAHVLDTRHRRLVRDNLRRSNLGLAEPAVRALSLDCFEHFGTMLVTSVRLLGCGPERLRAMTRIEGREHIEAAFAEGKGVIGLSGHLGNWERMGQGLSLEGWKLAVIGRELDNPYLDRRLKQDRMRFGNSVIAKSGAARIALRTLKHGQFVGFLLDQDALAAGVFVRFLGRWASTFSTAGMLACRLDAPVLPLSSRVEADGTVVITAYPPWHAERTDVPERDVWLATQRMTAWIEARVRENPGQWFCWLHRRFKTQPAPGEPPLPPDSWLEAAAGSVWPEVRPGARP